MTALALLLASLLSPGSLQASAEDDRKAVEQLDIDYQAAVKRNDAAGMGRILADDFVLVVGNGRAFDKADLLKSAEDQDRTYEQQDASNRTVRVWGDTAVVTALLWLKGKSKEGQPFDYKLWYSDEPFALPRAGATSSGRRRCGSRIRPEQAHAAVTSVFAKSCPT